MVIQLKEIVQVVTFLYRYYFKATGSIVYQVRSENGVEYCVTLNSNGTTGCYNRETGEECPGHKYAYKSGHDCHHVIDCQRREAERPENIVKSEIAAWERDEISFNDLSDAAQEIAGEIGEHEVQLQVAEYEEYEQWKRDSLLDHTMTREAYVACFDPCGMAV